MIDPMFEALGDKRRRQLLVRLLECSPRDTVPVSDVVSTEERNSEKLHLQMTHNHLPKLEDMEYIQWDRERDEIARGPQFESIEPSLQMLITHADTLPDDLI